MCLFDSEVAYMFQTFAGTVDEFGFMTEELGTYRVIDISSSL